MELKLYGHYGQPVLVFPAQNGRWYDWEGHTGMAQALAPMIEAGRVKFFCVDGIDWQSWTNQSIPPAERARRHNDYDAYIMGEVVPFVQKNTGLPTLWVTGCSMGALHAANFFFKYPEVFPRGLRQPDRNIWSVSGRRLCGRPGRDGCLLQLALVVPA
jgi:esterase/lipase superfamily enzyme